MARTRSTLRRGARAIRPRVKVWLECGDDYVFGHGISEILEAVDQTGSIKEAAAAVGKSYRHVWSRIKEAEAAFGRPLIVAHVGGTGTRRSFLTDEARELVADFKTLRKQVQKYVGSEFERRFGRKART
jgi:molybdate transport system regulatory protein